MTRQQVKLKAKEDIRGKVLMCFIPFLIIYGIQILIGYATAEKTYGIVTILIGLLMYPLQIGLALIFMNVVNNRSYAPSMSKLFEPYKNFDRLVQYLIAYALSMIYIFLGLICLIVPGIILAMRYSMLPYILADYPDISWKEALKKCKEITNGRKWEIFVYYISFFGWFLLVTITLGILSIYVLPYLNATIANLYYIYNPEEKIIVPEPIADGMNF